MLIVDSIGDLVLVLNPAPTGIRFSSMSLRPLFLYTLFDAAPSGSMMRRKRSRTGGGNCADAFFTSIFQAPSREFGISMRTRASFVSSA